jgi:hypothetical protein
MSISLRTAFLPILATALVSQPRLVPDALAACQQTTLQARVIAQVLSKEAAKLPGVVLSSFRMTRKRQS